MVHEYLLVRIQSTLKVAVYLSCWQRQALNQEGEKGEASWLPSPWFGRGFLVMLSGFVPAKAWKYVVCFQSILSGRAWPVRCNARCRHSLYHRKGNGELLHCFDSHSRAPQYVRSGLDKPTDNFYWLKKSEFQLCCSITASPTIRTREHPWGSTQRQDRPDGVVGHIWVLGNNGLYGGSNLHILRHFHKVEAGLKHRRFIYILHSDVDGGGVAKGTQVQEPHFQVGVGTLYFQGVAFLAFKT